MSLFGGLFGNLDEYSWIGICTKGLSFIEAMWIPFLLGIVIGWSWKPKWVTFRTDTLSSRIAKLLESPQPSSPSRSGMCTFKQFSLPPDEDSLLKIPTSITTSAALDNSNLGHNVEQISDAANRVSEKDLKHLYQLLAGKDGGPAWNHMMDRATRGMGYQAWTRDKKDGPPQYRSRTVFEDTSPETVRDFFWDDDFRNQWDDKLVVSNTIDECSKSGTLLVQWIRKFPFFCSDREYIIDRRIWQCGRSYYCVTKGVPCSCLPQQEKPKRVDLYYSSWFIQPGSDVYNFDERLFQTKVRNLKLKSYVLMPVESQRGDGQLSACEVVLFHHEDMGIPWEIAKFGVRQGMWSTVKQIEPGLRNYQKARASAAPLSRYAVLAQKNTIITPELLRYIRAEDELPEPETLAPLDKPSGMNLPKLLVIGGAIAIACTIDRGLLTKTFLFGVARKFANIGKRV